MPERPVEGVRARLRRDLARGLTLIEGLDQQYELRNALVLHAVATAAFLGYPAGFRVDPEEPEWPLAFIELPLPAGQPGQVSWHLPRHPRAWDGHTTAQKYERVRAFAAAVAAVEVDPVESPAASRLLALAELAETLCAGAPCPG